MCRLLVSARLSASSAPDGALLVYDITDEASFTRVKDWVKELRKMLSDELCIAIAGNKCDMEKSRFASNTALRFSASPLHATPLLPGTSTRTRCSSTARASARRTTSRPRRLAPGSARRLPSS